MQYDIYGSLVDGTNEKKLCPKTAKTMFSRCQLKEMCINGEEITRGIWKFWAEEALIYEKNTTSWQLKKIIKQQSEVKNGTQVK